MSQPAKLVLLALILPAVAFAQVQVHDLELEIIVDPPGVTPPGSTGTVTIIVTNHGPDPTMPFTPGFWEVFAGSDLIPFSLKYGELIDYNQTSPLADCRVIRDFADLPPGQPLAVDYGVFMPTINPGKSPGQPPAVGYGVFMPTINPGESRICEATFTVNPAAFAPDFEMSPWATNIFSTDRMDAEGWSATNYYSSVDHPNNPLRGTSYASPLVAGTAALRLSLDPLLSVSEVESELCAGAVSLSESNLGCGRLDAGGTIDTSLFKDGFETGDTSAWSSVTAN